jgi:Hypothetical glycosyl hydrolase family 15
MSKTRNVAIALSVLLVMLALPHGATRAGLCAQRRWPLAPTSTATATLTPSPCALVVNGSTICIGPPPPTNTQTPPPVKDKTLRLPMIQGGPFARVFPDSTDRILVFNDQLATSGMTEAQLQFAATHYVGTQKVLRDAARRLRQYNPNFLVLHYRLGQALGHSTPDQSCRPTTDYLQIIDGNQWIQEWPGDASVQEGWFFHVGGSRVFSCTNGHYLMELNDAGWRAWWSAQIIRQLQDNEDDGVFADSYSVPNYFGGCGWKPCLPDVDTVFEAAWAARERAFTDYIRAQFAGRWKWIPNVGALITTRDPSDYSNVDGAMVEGFAEWGDGNYFATDDWALQMNRILPLVAADKVLIGQTYPNSSDVQERLFVLGSYLLIKGTRTYINLDTGLDPEWFPEYTIDLGPPTDPLPVTISA